MGWQLTTLAHRLGLMVGRSHQDVGSRRGPLVDARQAALDKATAGLGPSARLRYEGILADHPHAVDAVQRTVAATRSVAAADELARRWVSLTAAQRLAVLDPVREMAHVGRQSDQTTCGSSSLVMLAALGDPTLALWLVSGWTPPSWSVPELSGASASQLASLSRAPTVRRFAVLQRVLKQRTNAGAVVGLPWPSRFGTPPWGAAREARFLDVRYTHRLLDDTDRSDLAEALDRVAASVERGVPVPLYSGGDTARGVGTALPRHVVLAFAAAPGGLAVWEPSAGRVLTLRTADVLDRHVATPALGGWNHLVWAVLPEV